MTVHHAITWAHMTALEHGGHDKFLPSLANDELRFTMASIREHFAAKQRERDDDWRRRQENWRESSDRCLTAATATLERVRASFATWCGVGGIEGPVDTLDSIGVALAGQPEAPCQPNTYEVWRGTEKRKDRVVLETTDIELAARTACADLSGQTFWGMRRQPEAPKGQREQPERVFPDGLICMMSDGEFVHVRKLQTDLAAANARIAELEQMAKVDRDALWKVIDERGAANARAVEWEQIAEQRHQDILDLTTDNTMQRRAAEDANARADAAERGRQTMVRAALDAEEQRDQLAARVKELELINAKLNEYRVRAGVCTPEERRVLGVCAAMRLCDDDPDADPLEPQELGEDCYIYTDDQGAIARAELANRAAKANRGGV
jgi:hypothetical protein